MAWNKRKTAGAKQAPAFLVEGAGNRFLLIDEVARAGTRQHVELQSTWVRNVCARRWGSLGLPIDGLLCLSRDQKSSALRMVIYNGDGSRPEACGNGLRCVAQHARDAGYCMEATGLILTDAGPRKVRFDGPAVQLGQARILGRDVEIETVEGSVRGTLVDMGNPHCVLWVDDVEEAPVAALGQLVEAHVLFPEGTNVEFAMVHADGALSMRVWERGVGETLACGTGACAVASARGAGASWPVAVRCPGGELLVDRDDAGELWLAGPIVHYGAVDLIFLTE